MPEFVLSPYIALLLLGLYGCGLQRTEDTCVEESLKAQPEVRQERRSKELIAVTHRLVLHDDITMGDGIYRVFETVFSDDSPSRFCVEKCEAIWAFRSEQMEYNIPQRLGPVRVEDRGASLCLVGSSGREFLFFSHDVKYTLSDVAQWVRVEEPEEVSQVVCTLEESR